MSYSHISRKSIHIKSDKLFITIIFDDRCAPEQPAPSGCTRLPNPAGSFPDCCMAVFQCTVVDPVPVVYDSSNITAMDEASKKHLLEIAGLTQTDTFDLENANEIYSPVDHGIDPKTLKKADKKNLIDILHKVQHKESN